MLLTGRCDECGKPDVVTFHFRCEAVVDGKLIQQDVEVCRRHAEGWREHERRAKSKSSSGFDGVLAAMREGG